MGWFSKKTAVSPVVQEAPVPSLGSGRGWIDNEGVFWFKKGPGAPPVAKDVFVVDDLLVKHGGDNWIEPITVLETSELAIKQGGKFAKNGYLMKKKALRDLAALSRKVFDLEPLTPDGSGTTEAEAVLILTDYLAWVGKVASEFLPLPVSLA